MAYREFWTCEGTFGKTWVLKPRVVHWIYTIMITHILAYNLMVWWKQCQQDRVQ